MNYFYRGFLKGVDQSILLFLGGLLLIIQTVAAMFMGFLVMIWFILLITFFTIGWVVGFPINITKRGNVIARYRWFTKID